MFDLVEKEDFEFDRVSLFAKGNCKYCHGKGYEISQVGSVSPNTGRFTRTITRKGITKTYYKECPCVSKNKVKYKETPHE